MEFDTNTAMKVVSTYGFRKGCRILVGEKDLFVVKKVDNSTTMTVRPYRWYDALWDWIKNEPF